MRAVKLAVTEALRAMYATSGLDITPKYIGIEYPEQEPTWPAVLVQFRPASSVQWSGVNPDIAVPVTGSTTQWTRIRAGQFSGSIELMILALSSGERDHIWDSLTSLVLMGSLRSDTSTFRDMVNQSDVVAITMQEDRVQQVGDSIGGGVPWDPDLLSYEATIRFDIVGQFYFDWYNQTLAPLGPVQVYGNNDQEPPFGENDGDGAWK